MPKSGNVVAVAQSLTVVTVRFSRLYCSASARHQQTPHGESPRSLHKSCDSMRLSQKTCASGYEGESPQTCTPWLAEIRDGFVSVEVTQQCNPLYLWHEQTSCQSVPVCLVSNGILILICVFERVLVYNQKKTTCLQSLTSTFKTFSLHSSGLRKQTGLPLTVGPCPWVAKAR